jgi:hypothetical protein
VAPLQDIQTENLDKLVVALQTFVLRLNWAGLYPKKLPSQQRYFKNNTAVLDCFGRTIVLIFIIYGSNLDDFLADDRNMLRKHLDAG